MTGYGDTVAAEHEPPMPTRVVAINAAIDDTRTTGTVATPSRRKLFLRILMLSITAISLYLLFPALVSVLGSWKDLERVNPGMVRRRRLHRDA